MDNMDNLSNNDSSFTSFLTRAMIYYCLSLTTIKFIKYINSFTQDVKQQDENIVDNSNLDNVSLILPIINKFIDCDVGGDGNVDNITDTDTNTNTNTQKQFILNTMTSLNSIDRVYILYYIFKRKGDYILKNNKDNLNQKETTTNCLYEFNIYQDLYGKDNFNLDLSLEKDIDFTIGDITYTMNSANLAFISWLYYSNIFNYLMNNEKLKYEILNEVNNENKLYGNLFLRYHLFTCDYEKRKELEEYENEETSDDDSSEAEESEDSKESNCDFSKNYITDYKNEISNEYVKIYKNIMKDILNEL